MKTRMRNRLTAVAVMVIASTAGADVIIKADNADALGADSSWVDGVAPGTNDVATWNAALTASRTYSLGGDLSWLGMAFTADPGGNVTFNAGNTLTLGEQGIASTPNRTITLNNAIELGADQSWAVGSGTFIPGGALNMAGRTLTLSGGATKQFKGAISGGGRIVVNGTGSAGYAKFTNAGTAAPETDVFVNNANLNFETATGLASGPRTKSLTLGNGASLSIGGRSDSDTVETNANELAAGTGMSTVTVTPNAAKNAMFYSGSFARGVGGGAMVFRGTGLGTNMLASLTPNSANLVFGTAPALLGAGGTAGSSTCSILPGAFGDTNLTSSGTGMGLVTYDAAYGLYPLSVETEYAVSITDGQSQLDNVRLANATGAGVLTSLLTQDTTVNSLSLVVTGTSTDGGIVVTGETDRVLTVASGCIYASQTLSGTPNANDVQRLAVPVLNLNGREGVIFRRTASVSNGEEPACLEIRSSVTNDGGNGVTFVGPGLTYIVGSVVSAYTGPTVCQSGNLRISKSVPNIGVPGALIVEGGAVQNTGNQLPDTSDVHIRGGGYYQKGGALNSGTGASETFRDLFMTGGTFHDGAGGTSSGSTALTNAVLSGGTWSVTQGHSTRIGGVLSLSGGQLSIGRAQDTSRNTTVTVAGRTTVTNTAAGVYVPILIAGGAGAGVNGGRLVLLDDVTVIGDSANTNPVTVAATAASSGGLDAQLRLDGLRTFYVGDGPAEIDAVLYPVLADNGATAGGLMKHGPGTLELAATNAFTGGTSVEEGALLLNGGLASPVTVSSEAALSGTGSVAVTSGTALTVAAGGLVCPGASGAAGTLSITGQVSFAAASVLRVNVDGAAASHLAVSGTVSGGPVAVQKFGEGAGPWRILTATQVMATFVTSEPGMTVYKLAGDTELWLGPRSGTLISLL